MKASTHQVVSAFRLFPRGNGVVVLVSLKKKKGGAAGRRAYGFAFFFKSALYGF